MISEEQQDLAALYALGSLDQSESDAFEASLVGNAELTSLVSDLREATSALVLAAPARRPSSGLKQRILQEIAAEKTRGQVSQVATGRRTTSSSGWPWAIAAMFLLFSGFLLYDRMQMRREMQEVRNADRLMQTTLISLAAANGAPPEAKATVAWEPDRQTGVIKITGMPAAGTGKDYQLWAVDEAYKDPVSAGIVHVDANGVAQVRFKPIAETRHVKAFALSLEREGGVPKAQGPILLVGANS